jgi:hypothetical protein
MTFFFDEGRFGLQSTVCRLWAEKGKELKVKVKQGFKNFYMYSAICPVTGDDFSLILPFVCTDMMNLYIKSFSEQYQNQKLILIMDQAGWHKSKDLAVPENITIIFLPPYSPELNPVERFWRFLKKEVLHNVIYETLGDLTTSLGDFYSTIEKDTLKSLCNCSYL